MNSCKSITVTLSYSDFGFICRICFAKDNLRSLKRVEYLMDVLKSLTNTQISEDDGLPQNICVNCIRKLEEISDFLDLSQYSDLSLRHVLLTKVDTVTNTISWSNNEHKETTSKSDDPIGDVNIETFDGNAQDVLNCNKKEETVEKHKHTRHKYRNISRICLTSQELNTIDERRKRNRIAKAKSRERDRLREIELMETLEDLNNVNSSLLKKKKYLEKQIEDLQTVLSKYKCTNMDHNLGCSNKT
ncbi:unnamed protein product [Phyllotreta striolata]|uniref:Uncharacterized protein n=1 Tax=Phyllotreta striolata TaxID=444603 RepID=A0A9N9XLQ4_PHYSR|nr:unnamed protein product [Phyllotreta striolata]